MNELITHVYREIEITYRERDDDWNFMVNGRERSLESLTKAKESIDRALDYEKKERPWKPFTAYLKKYGNDPFVLVTITSQAETSRYSNAVQYWVSQPNGKKKERSKESAIDLYAATPENEQAIAKWITLDAEIEALSAQQRQLVEGMAQVETPSPLG